MLGLLLSLSLVLEPGSAATPPKAAAAPRELPGDGLLKEAKALRYGQRWFEAAEVYRRYLREFAQGSRVPDARFWLAATLEQDQRWDEAAAAYTDFLKQHPDQRLLGKEARLNRLRCWGIRQGQNAEATSGLVASLAGAEDSEVQVVAALQLAKVGDKRGVDALQRGLSMPAYADACSLALMQLGVKAKPTGNASTSRFLVIKVQEKGKAEVVTLRLALGLARAVENYLSEAQVKQARAKGIALDQLSEQAASLPKGSTILSVEDKKSTITISVE